MTLHHASQHDPGGAFLPNAPVIAAGAETGPLAGLSALSKTPWTFKVSARAPGNPDWLRTHPPAASTAWSVQTMLDAGASIAGKTITDELTFSLNGENIHYGTPLNPRAPGRIPGGSSSGSAVAVAGELVDFALGTDCGGSVRAPGELLRYLRDATLARPDIDGRRFSTRAELRHSRLVLARDAVLLERVGRILLRDESTAPRPRRLLLVTDAFARCGDRVTSALQNSSPLSRPPSVPWSQSLRLPTGSQLRLQAFRLLQGAEIWAEHGEWIRDTKPNLAPDIRERFEWTSTIKPADVAASQLVRDHVSQRMRELLGDEAVLCLPTTPGIAPLLSMPASQLGEFRNQSLSLLCIAGLARLPQINLPLATLDGCPLGLSIIGPHGADVALLQLAAGLVR